MPTPPVARIGVYEILAPLGAGGMGEVWRARDTRLNRDVAVKTLPQELASDPEFLGRLRREARLLASLRHPGITTIHGLEEVDGQCYLVLECVEGPTLAERLEKGRLPVREALEVCRQIAAAIETAHESGVIHRDLKPANVKLVPGGEVKVLDFGVGKFMAPPRSAPAESAPTLTVERTSLGTIVGTAAYMSPEQALGQEVDRRTDIWSFGCVLFECLSGSQAFGGQGFSATVARVLEREPEWSTLPEGTPARVRALLSQCLVKNPKERQRDIGDARLELERVIRGEGESIEPRPRVTWWVLPAATALVAATLGFLAGTLPKTAPAQSPVLVHRLTDSMGLEESPAISPDGKSVAFAAYVGNQRQISVRLVTGGRPLRITQDDTDHESPRWAPDGASLLYYSPPREAEPQGTIWEVPALGGSPRRIASSIGGADVSHDGKRIAFFRSGEGTIELATASRDGGEARVIAKLPLGFYYFSPRWSPDDRRIGYQRGYVFSHDVYEISADGGEARPMTSEGRLISGFAWTADGSGIVYSSSRGSTLLYLPTFNLWVVGRDGKGLRQLTFGEVSYIDPDVNAAGTLVVSRIRREFNVWKFPADGAARENVRRGVQITHQTGQVQTPSVGATDREIVYVSDSGGHANLWIANTESGATRQITNEQDPEIALGVPIWSADGRQITFYCRSSPGGPLSRPRWTAEPWARIGGSWLINPDGGNLRNLIHSAGWAVWSRDGRWIYYTELEAGFVQGAIKKVRPEGGPSVTVRSGKGNSRPAISPDGSTIYFVVEKPTHTGGSDYEVHAASPETAQSHVIARIPARRIPPWQLVHPVISPDGKWLAMPLTDGLATNIWALPTAGGELRQLTDFGQRATFIARRVSWSVDGRFLFAALGEGDADVVLLRGLTDKR